MMKISVFIFSLLIPLLAFAGEETPTIKPGEGGLFRGKFLQTVAEKGGFETNVNESFFLTLLGMIAFAILSLLGIMFLGLMIYAGFRWMLARGNEEEVRKAVDIIKHSVIGLAIIAGAYAIWRFIALFISP